VFGYLYEGIAGFFSDGLASDVLGTIEMVTHPLRTASELWDLGKMLAQGPLIVSSPYGGIFVNPLYDYEQSKKLEAAGEAIQEELTKYVSEHPDRAVGVAVYEIATLVIAPAKLLKVAKARWVARAAKLTKAEKLAARGLDASGDLARSTQRTSTAQHVREIAEAEHAIAPVGDDAAILAKRVELQDIIANNAFYHSRDLGEYRRIVGGRFQERLGALRPDQHWIDMGAGDAVAIREYYKGLQGTKGARTTALAYSEPLDDTVEITTSAGRTVQGVEPFRGPKYEAFQQFASETPEFRPMFGKMLDEYSLDEIGKADLVTDVMGPLSYAERMDGVFAKYADITNVGGEIHTHIPHQTFIVDAAGKQVPIAEFAREWIGQSRGLELVEVGDAGAEGTRIVVRKVGEDVRVPELTLKALGAGKPPIREYVWQPTPRRELRAAP